MVGSNLRIDVKLVILIAILMGALTSAVCYWSAQTHQEQMRQELVEQARGFTQQMDAVWQFVDVNQDRINYSSSGDFEFKGLQCSVAAKSVAHIFSLSSDYEIQFTRTNPRNEADSPDEWEQDALEAFAQNPQTTEYYQLLAGESSLSLRYCAPLRVSQGCLQCHGEPAGEIDVTGYAKEGWRLGDLAGATSVTIPADEYVASYSKALARDLLFYLLAVFAALAVTFFAVRYLASKPLRNIAEGLAQVGSGGLSIKLSTTQSTKEIASVVSSFNNMTDELNDLYNTLEQKVESRTEELHQATEEVLRQKEDIQRVNKRIEQESAYKSEFLAVMSHELKTPLTATITYLETLQSPSSSLSPTDREIAMRGEASSRELLMMIDNILEVSRSRELSETMHWELVDLFDIVEYVTAEVDPLAQKRNTRIVKKNNPLTPLIFADWEKLRHILLNLLGNAIKYSPEGGRIALTVEPWLEDVDSPHNTSEDAGVFQIEKAIAPKGAVITVADNGCGIPPDELDGIFERFYRVDPSIEAHHNGSGLGLFIVKEYARLHGGTVSVESELSQGSTFTLFIPSNAGKGRGEETAL
jgi:signal transduction histidine kinase